MSVADFCRKLPAYIRWSVFERCGRFLLGCRYHGMLAGKHLVTDLSFGIQAPSLEEKLVGRKKINDAEIVNYNFPDVFPGWFPRENAFESKWGYLFSGCRVDPRFGAVSTLDGDGGPDVLLVPSLIGFEVFMQGGMYEGMMPKNWSKISGVVFPFASCLAYYHELVEVMLAALQAREWQPQMKVLLHPQHPKFIDDMLEFFGFTADDIVKTGYPVDVEKCVVIPRWRQRSAISMSDAVYMRERIHERINTECHSDKVYVSRRKASTRALKNEAVLERRLIDKGFRVVYFEDMSIADQFKAVAKAKTIVAVHGSGLANLVAAQKGSRVVEIISPEWRRSTFARLSAELGLEYSFVGAVADASGGFSVPIDAVIEAIGL